MKILKIKDIIGTEYAVSSENSEKIYNHIKILMDKKENINISFEGIEIVISAFLNRTIGDLYENYDKNDIENLITFSNTNSKIDELILLVKETAKEFYKVK